MFFSHVSHAHSTGGRGWGGSQVTRNMTETSTITFFMESYNNCYLFSFPVIVTNEHFLQAVVKLLRLGLTTVEANSVQD